jgi:guanylate kinase
MTIILLGASGSGKSTIEKILADEHNYERIVSYTTRSPRDNEVNGVDYYFINNETFTDMIEADLFAEYDEYSQNRLYGTLKSDYVDGNKVVVLTPNGFRKIKQNCKTDNICTILVNANLGTRVKRYIDRCGVDKFNFDDKNEIAARVERDFSMFLGLEKEVDLVIHNNEGTDINSLVRLILSEVNNR